MRRTVHQVVVVLGFSACGRVGFDAPADARPGDGDTTDARTPWHEPFTLEPPVLVPELTFGDGTVECFVTPGGLRMYFSRVADPQSVGGFDIYVAERSDESAAWTNVQDLVDLSTVNDEARVVTNDDLRAYFWSERAGSPDIYTVARASTAVPFRDVDAVQVTGLASAGTEYDPWLSGDGQRIYYMGDGPAMNDIYVADRVSDTQFGNARAVPGVNSSANEDNPTLSPDELFIVFASDRGRPSGVMDLYYATRADRSQPFGTPQLLPAINTPESRETEACLTAGGELYFSSDRPVGSLVSLYRTRFIPL